MTVTGLTRVGPALREAAGALRGALWGALWPAPWLGLWANAAPGAPASADRNQGTAALRLGISREGVFDRLYNYGGLGRAAIKSGRAAVSD